MRTGRPPVPNELKERRGTLRPDRLPATADNAAVVAIMDEIPRAPRGLSPAAQKLWRDLWEHARTWVIQGLDTAIVEQTCRVYDEIGLLRAEIRKTGMLLKEPIATPSGKVVGERLVANPAVKLLRDAEKAWNQYLVLLAIPPTERARLGLTQVKAQSKMEKLLAGRSQRPDGVENGQRSALPAANQHSGT